MNRSRVTGDLASHGNIFVDIANDRVGIGSTIPGEKLSLPDSAKIALGNSADLQIYHSGAQSVIKDSGTGGLSLFSNNFQVFNAAENEYLLTATENGAVELYHNNSKKFQTTAYGVNVTGTTDTDGLVVSGVTTISGTVTTGDLTISDNNPTITFNEGDGNPDYRFIGNNGTLAIQDIQDSYAQRFTILSNGNINIQKDLDVDGHTNLDNVNIVGVVTVTGAVNASHSTFGNLNTTGITIQNTNASINFTDTNNNPDYSIIVDGGVFDLNSVTPAVNIIKINTDGHIDINTNVDFAGTSDFTGDATFSGGGGAITIAANSDIEFGNSATWTGNTVKIQHHNSYLYLVGGSNGLVFREGGSDRWIIDGDGHFRPSPDSTHDIGTNSVRVRNGYFDTLYGDGSNLTAVNATTLDSIDSASFLRSDAADTTTGDITFSGGAGAVTVSGGSDIRLIGGTWTGEYTGGIKIQPDATNSYFQYHGGMYFRNSAGANRLYFDSAGNTTIVGNLTVNGTYSGSGASLTNVNATTLDSIDSGSFLRSDDDDTATRRVSFHNNATDNEDTIATATGSQGGIEIYNTGSGNDAFMAFHGGGDFAFYLGLDADTNDLSVGGWSMGANKYKVWHAGNDGSGSGLDADSVDGIAGSSLLRSDTADTASGDITFNGGAGAVTIAADSDIRFTTGNWTGEYAGKIQYHSNRFYFQTGSLGWNFRDSSAVTTLELSPAGTITGKQLSFTQDAVFNGGAGAVNIGANSDIRFTSGSWTGESCKIQHHGNWLYIQAPSSGFLFRNAAGANVFQIANDGHLSTDQGDIEFDNDAKFNGGAGAVTIAANSDIRFTTGNWTGEDAKIQRHNDYLYIQGAPNGHIFRRNNGSDAWVIQSNGHFRPGANNTYDIGNSTYRVANIYVNDLQLSNKAKKDTGGNDVDGTWGDWTIQEGESDLFLINNRNDKKYKFNLTEVTK